MNFKVTRFAFADAATMQRASDVLGAENALIANICSGDANAVVVRSHDQGAARKLLETAGLMAASVETSAATDDEIQILMAVSDAPDLGSDWREDDLAPSFHF